MPSGERAGRRATREPSDRRAESRAVADRRNGPRPTAERSAQFFFQGQNLFLCVTELFFSKSRAPLLSVRDRRPSVCAHVPWLLLRCAATRWTLDTATRRAARGRADRSRPVPLTAGAERRANLGPRGVQCTRAAHACTQPTATTPHRMARPRAALPRQSFSHRMPITSYFAAPARTTRARLCLAAAVCDAGSPQSPC